MISLQRLRPFLTVLFVGAVGCVLSAASVRAETPAERGYRLLTTKAYLPADFDQRLRQDLDHLGGAAACAGRGGDARGAAPNGV